MTAKALRCNTRLELTVEEFLFLDRIPGAGHAVPARLYCELEHEHRGDHVAFAQTGEGVSGPQAVWWMRWNAASRAIVELPPCLARDPGWPEDQDEDDPMFCWLPAEHRAAHEWEMRSDLEFTRTANGVSELGKDRLRAVPHAAGPQLRIHRDEKTIAVRWPDWPRWLMIWPPEYPGHHLERHPAAQTEWRRDMRDADFDDPQWIDPAFHHHRDVPKLTRAVRDELRRAAASIGRRLDAIETHPWRP